MTDAGTDPGIGNVSNAAVQQIRAVLATRGAATACPSEVARRLDPAAWRDRMDEVRAAAAALAAAGELEVTQRGVVVDIGSARGPVRLRRVADPRTGKAPTSTRDPPQRAGPPGG